MLLVVGAALAANNAKYANHIFYEQKQFALLALFAAKNTAHRKHIRG